MLGRSVSEVLGLLFVLLAVQLIAWLLIDALPNIVYPQYKQRIVENIQSELFKNMLDACQNRTLIFISHRLSSAVLADSIFLFYGGEIIEAGRHDEMMTKNGKYAEIFRMFADGKLIEVSTHDELMAQNDKYAETFKLQAEKYRKATSA